MCIRDRGGGAEAKGICAAQQKQDNRWRDAIHHNLELVHVCCHVIGNTCADVCGRYYHVCGRYYHVCASTARRGTPGSGEGGRNADERGDLGHHQHFTPR
eukprot:1852551-Prymnesium_polylepis.1